MNSEPSTDGSVCIYDPLIELMKQFENVRAETTSMSAFEGLKVEDALKLHIVKGIRKSLEERLDEAMLNVSPLQIINGVLLDGMKTVGELFGSGKMQLPFVLQSAEVMKAAVRYLEPFMDKVNATNRGSILLATVAGDVHDIGKNLVDIILSNNGYRVVNIGIKQSIGSILERALESKCDVIGMSGLLVKSTLVMRDNLVEMNERGLSQIPVILGGAALTRSYVEQDLRQVYRGQVHYARDAFEGLRLMEELSTDAAENLSAPSHHSVVAHGRSHRIGNLDASLFEFDGAKSDVKALSSPPPLPFYGAKKRDRFDVSEIFRYINPIALFRGQWQYKRPKHMSNPEFASWLASEADPIFLRLKRELAGVLKPQVKWGYFPAASEGNDLIIGREDRKTEYLRFTFPRQRDGRRLCLADFFQARSSNGTVDDVVGFQLVTVGTAISELERELFSRGEYREYLYVHGIAVECAEALAEYWHLQMRREMGIDDHEPAEMKQLFSARYHGARYSFGYPACPNLDDQRLLFELLIPEDIGIELSEESMLIPEASTSAIIIHHPEAKYFNVK